MQDDNLLWILCLEFYGNVEKWCSLKFSWTKKHEEPLLVSKRIPSTSRPLLISIQSLTHSTPQTMHTNTIKPSAPTKRLSTWHFNATQNLVFRQSTTRFEIFLPSGRPFISTNSTNSKLLIRFCEQNFQVIIDNNRFFKTNLNWNSSDFRFQYGESS